jgi:TIR domain
LGGVFISYRREESSFAARAICDRVAQKVGRENIFLDVDNIDLGVDWFEVLAEKVGACDALIAVIGKNWVSSADEDDFIRFEIESALQRNVRVIPVLVDGAKMPRADELPDAIKNLARRQGIEISHNHFDSDVERLTDALVRIGKNHRRPQSNVVAARRSTLPTKPFGGIPRWLPAVIVLVVITGGAALFNKQVGPYAAFNQQAGPYAALNEQFGPYEEPSRTEEKAEPNFNVLSTLPPPQTTSALNIAAPSSTAASPVITATSVAPAAPYEVQSGEANHIAASRIGKPDSSDPLTGPQRWMNLHDSSVDYRRQIVSSYPDRAWARCQNGTPQRAAHWSPRPAGQHFELRGMSEKTFEADAAVMTGRGFKTQYDNVFQSCDGTTQHQTLWMKGG